MPSDVSIRLKADTIYRSKWCPALAGLLLITSCATRLPPRPAGTPSPDPTAAEAFVTATAACKGFRSIEGELSLSGRAGGERVRGRILTGLEAGGLIRLEAVAPFGAPFFILAGSTERATLLLPRERRVLKDASVPDVLARVTGLALGADDLRLIVSGCLVDKPSPTNGRQWGGGWRAVTLDPQATAYMREQNGVPVVTAAEYGAGKSLAPRPRHSLLSLDKIISSGFRPADAMTQLRSYLSSLD